MAQSGEGDEGVSHTDRVRALLKELEQALDQLEAEAGKPKKRKPATLRKPTTQAAVAETRRRLRGAG